VSRAAAACALCLALAASATRAAEPTAPAAAPAAAPATTGPAPAKPPDAVDRLGIHFSKTAELVITSDEAEGVKDQDGKETVIFTKNVKAKQADMTLDCDWLKAMYPDPSAGRPDHIYAKGNVVITQVTSVAHCVEAEIDNVACTAECRSQGTKATLHRETDDVEGDTIYFDLCKGTVKAVGNVQVRVRQKQNANDPNAPAAPAAAPAAPAEPAKPKAAPG
jgi:lipopolysaccharide export system protein LptA